MSPWVARVSEVLWNSEATAATRSRVARVSEVLWSSEKLTSAMPYQSTGVARASGLPWSFETGWGRDLASHEGVANESDSGAALGGRTRYPSQHGDCSAGLGRRDCRTRSLHRRVKREGRGGRTDRHCPKMNPLRQRLGTTAAVAFGHGDPAEARSLAYGAHNAAEGAGPYRRAGGRPEAVASVSPRHGRGQKQTGEGTASARYDAHASALRSEKTERRHRLAGREARWPASGPRAGRVLAPGGGLPALRARIGRPVAVPLRGDGRETLWVTKSLCWRRLPGCAGCATCSSGRRKRWRPVFWGPS